MKLKLVRHLWGVEDSYEQTFPAFKQFGYEGIEAPLPGEKMRPALSDHLLQHDFFYIPQVFSGGQTVQAHIESLAKSVKTAMAFTPRPIMLNAHSALDAFTFDEAIEFYKAALQISKDAGIEIAHETHRGRYFFNPWDTAAVLKELPEIKLCCDFSHWVCVCERLLNGCEKDVQLAAKHAIHVHARVGYEEGPQVPDPSAPEYQAHLERHETWWDWIWDARKEAGADSITMTPEFGPPRYMHTLPHTDVPVADLATVCDWIANRQRHRYVDRG